MKVLNVKHTKGKYQGYDFDNVVMQCSVPCEPVKSGDYDGISTQWFGDIRVKDVKVPFAVFMEAGVPLADIVGKDISCAYNEYGKVETLFVK